MFGQTIFREKSLARRARRESLDSRLQVTAPHEWIFLSALGITILGLLIYGLIGKTERSLTFEAVMVQPGERIDIVAVESGIVVDILAEVGETVTKGQSVVRVHLVEPRRSDDFRGQLRDPQVGSDNVGSRPSADSIVESSDKSEVQDIVASHDGELVSIGLTRGQRVGFGDLAARIRTMSRGQMEAIAFIRNDEVVRIATEMPAEVRLSVPRMDHVLVLPARVAFVSARVSPVPPWLAEMGLDAPVHAHLLRATLTEPAPQTVTDGAIGTLHIILGDRSLVSLLFGSNTD